MPNAVIRAVTIHQLAIPLRRQIAHAAFARSVSEPVVVAIELDSGILGYGETLPRPYVTGESVESVVDAVARVYVPALVEMHPAGFPHALEAVESLPWSTAVDRACPAARCAVELALLDAYSKQFQRPISDAAGWMGINEFGGPGSLPSIRHSGVLASAKVKRLKSTLRRLWWYGIRDFKLKVGDAGEHQRLEVVQKYLARPIESGRATLGVDANGGWSLSQAVERLTDWRAYKLAFVEQPLARGAEQELSELKSCVHQPLMYDESLVTMADAESLVQAQVADAFNIRISKCGGFLPSLKLAHYAAKQGITIQLGCMVGETSILSSAGRKFLELVPRVRFAEGSFGRFLLCDDLIRRPLTFGYGGRVKPIPGFGWGIDVDPTRLDELTLDRARYAL
ncbi:MAG: enolase C-terminal domain-like protein [Phycisphaerae bacterium]